MNNTTMLNAYHHSVIFFNDCHVDGMTPETISVMIEKEPAKLLRTINDTALLYDIAVVHSSFEEISNAYYLNAHAAVSALVKERNPQPVPAAQNEELSADDLRQDVDISIPAELAHDVAVFSADNDWDFTAEEIEDDVYNNLRSRPWECAAWLQDEFIDEAENVPTEAFRQAEALLQRIHAVMDENGIEH